ncbi:MAG TPA: dual specificity protein phosphatase family protein [Terriglobales bacterium]|jgi:tyrosine-protein phosphatase SIW14|nr:dual specificity protein phosphatase family protein [Terriglobales bacterium]
MKLTVRIFFWLLLAFTMCLGAAPPQIHKDTAPRADDSFGRHRALHGVRNFGEVTPMLYRGGQPTHEGFKRLSEMGINIVVDVGRSKRDEKQIKQLGMRYVSLPWYCPFPKDDVFQRFLKLIQENPEKKIFVHCRLGDDRTGMMIAAYRMGIQGWTAERAMEEMHFFGYTGVHHLMCPGLAGYEKSFPARLKKDPSLRGLN